MGPVKDPHYNGLADATWNEKLAGILLVVGIVAIGIAPFWLSDLLTPGVNVIMGHVGKAIIAGKAH